MAEREIECGHFKFNVNGHIIFKKYFIVCHSKNVLWMAFKIIFSSFFYVMTFYVFNLDVENLVHFEYLTKLDKKFGFFWLK